MKELDKFHGISTDDIAQNPHKYGAPTFEEFKRNREKYIGRWDDGFSQIERGPDRFRKDLRKIHYEIEGVRCKTLEEVEKRAAEMGINLNTEKYQPEMIPQGGGKYELLVKFVSTDERKRRREW